MRRIIDLAYPSHRGLACAERRTDRIGDHYCAAFCASITPYPRTYYTGELGRTYDVSRPDGARFLAVKAAAPSGEPAPGPPRLEIALGWLDELEARAPRGARRPDTFKRAPADCP